MVTLQPSAEPIDAAGFGAAAVGALVKHLGDDGARRFVDAIVQPTRPGSPERAEQDRAWSILTRRLTNMTEAGASLSGADE